MKKIISIILICAMITGCSEHQENTREESSVSDIATASLESEETPAVNSTEENSTSAVISSVEPTSSSQKEQETEESVGNTSSNGQTSSSNEENSNDVSMSVDEPQWNETPEESTKYINTNGIYSRKTAIVGSEAVKRYSVNDKVSVVAVTDTDYYKLDDGTFIHKDYLSEKEVEVKPVTTTPSVSTDTKALLNNAALKPMKTNSEMIDGAVDEWFSMYINSSMSTYEKVTAVYDAIIKNCSYGTDFWTLGVGDMYDSAYDSKVVNNADMILSGQCGVCDNYAAAFMVMTRRIGLESYVVEGWINSTAHAWVIIKLSGNYYLFDSQVEQRNTTGTISHGWFCKPESSMSGAYTYSSNRDSQIAKFGGFKKATETKPQYVATETIMEGYFNEDGSAVRGMGAYNKAGKYGWVRHYYNTDLVLTHVDVLTAIDGDLITTIYPDKEYYLGMDATAYWIDNVVPTLW